MARKSVEDRSIIPMRKRKPGDAAPARMTDAERALWRRIIDSKPADWFGKDALPLLTEYVRAASMCDRLAGKVSDAVDGSDPKALKVLLGLRDTESRRMSIIATKLRLTPQSRYGPRAAATADKRADGPRPWRTVDPDAS